MVRNVNKLNKIPNEFQRIEIFFNPLTTKNV